MGQIIARHISQCLTCNQTKTRQIQAPAPQRTHIAEHPFQKWSLDVLGPYKETRQKNKYVIIEMDLFTKWIEAKPYDKVDGKTLTNFLEQEILPRYGQPAELISDAGGQMKSRTYENFCRDHNINILRVAVQHQRTNPVERKVQDFKKVLRALMQGKPDNTWDKKIPKVLYILRNRKNAATNETPAKLVPGKEMPRMGDWELPEGPSQRVTEPDAMEAVALQAQQHQRTYKQKHAPADKDTPIQFRVGDFVMAKETRRRQDGFYPVWTRPHIITRKITDEVYEVGKNGALPEVHVDDLRPATERAEQDAENSKDEEGPENPPPAPADDQEPPAEDNSLSETEEP